MVPSILIVEQSDEITELFSAMQGEYIINRVRPIEFHLNKIQERPIDIVIIKDPNIGYQSIELCRTIRTEEKWIPIMIITENFDELNAVLSYELGTDDYITMPLNQREFHARVKARLRRNSIYQNWNVNHFISIGNIRVYPDQYKVLNGNVQIELTTREFELLRYLSENRGRACSRKELSEVIKGKTKDNQGRNVDVHIANIRRKIPTVNFIKTIKKLGYCIE